MNIKDIKNKLKTYTPYILGSDKMLLSSVLIPLVELNDELHLIFEVRSSKLRSQPLDISFPGGKIDKEDSSPMESAIRETCEELGIEKDDIEIIKELDLLVAPYGIIIHNFLGKIKDISKIKINEDEVDSIFMVPISFFKNNEPIRYKARVDLLKKDDFPFDLVPFGKDYPFKFGFTDVLFWRYENKTIWGMTAGIVENFISLI